MEFDCLEKLKIHLTDLKNSEDIVEQKKAGKLNYWVKDYLRFLENENNLPVFKYKRGSIVKAHLGFRIGHEHGGLHYCVVINSNYYLTSGLLTVIPLTSINKPNKPLHHTSVYLGSELKDGLLSQIRNLRNKTDEQSLVILKFTELYDKFMLHHESQNSKQLLNLLRFFDNKENYEYIKAYVPAEYLELVSLKLSDEDINESVDYQDLCNIFEVQKLKEYTNNSIPIATSHIAEQEKTIKSLEKQSFEIGKMKDMSKALVDQITTVSSIRVYNPISSYCSLANIKLSNESLDKIDVKVKELFIKN